MPTASLVRARTWRTVVTLVACLCAAGASAAPRVLVYRWPTDQTLRYKIAATVNGKLPLFESKEPIDLEANLSLVYAASGKARTADGNYPVSFRVLSAEAEIAKIPFDVPKDQAHKILDQSVVLKASGDVVTLKDSAPLPFSVSIPGIDLKQLHTLLVPVVFPDKPVQAGDTWTFRCALLGKDGASPYKATLVSLRAAHAGKGAAAALEAIVRTEFSMDIDQKLGKNKKPAETPDDVVHARSGKVVGSGTFRFNVTRGRLAHGEVKVEAHIADDVVGPLESPDDPRHVDSVVNAVITVTPDTESKPAAAKPKASSGQSIHK